MTEDVGRWLLTPEGEGLTKAAAQLRAERVDLPQALGTLRKRETPERAAAAWELADLRARGAAKFGTNSSRLYFVREALEQASSLRAAAYHADCFRRAGIASVADVCGGIGGDAVAFARAGLRVTLFERDPLRALFAAANVRALGLQDWVRVVSAPMKPDTLGEEAIWFDPARRTAGSRTIDPKDYEPPLSTMTCWKSKSVGVKLAPAVPHAVALEYDAELEFLSDSGDCKEALLWTGALRTGTARRATLLRDADAVHLDVDLSLSVEIADATAGGFLYEPDPAVIRAGGVATLAERLKARLAAPQIAYLIGAEHVPTPIATAYAILERFPYSQRRLQSALTRLHVGRIVIKKRGFPREPEDVRRELRLRGAEEITVVLTRAADGDGHQVILCRPVPAD